MTAIRKRLHSRRRFMRTAVGVLLGSAGMSRLSGADETFQVSGSSVGPSLDSVRYLGNQFLDNRVGVTGADGATSTVLPNGDSLWVFGDTVEGPFESIRKLDLAGLRSNTGAIVPSQNSSRGIERFQFLAGSDGKRPRQLVPFANDEVPSKHRVWAIHGTCVGDRIYLYYHRITLLEGVDVFLNFQLDGMGLARADVGELQFTRLTAPDGTHEYWKGDDPSFGVCVERDEEYVYLWGCLATGMFLARTRPAAIEDLAAYEYLVAAPTPQRPDVAPRWSKKFEPTAALFDSVPNEMSASYNAHLKRHVAFHSLHREHKILMRTAPQRTGPWSEGEVVFRPERIGADDLIYAAKEHPELAREGGRVLYVTFINATTYVPQMIELTLR